METNSEKKRVCTNCAFCERIGHGIGYIPEKYWTTELRCWKHPDVVDHPRVFPLEEGDNYSCEEHMFREERDDQLKWIARNEYEECRRKIVELEERYPEFKEMKI